MQTSVKKSAIDTLLESLLKSNHDNEFKMTAEGFKTKHSKIYEPRDLRILKTYHFEGSAELLDSYDIYLIRSNDGLVGYSLNAANDFQKHEENLYNWFIKKIPVETLA